MNQFFHQRRELLYLLNDLRRPGAKQREPLTAPKDLFLKCPGCGEGRPRSQYRANNYVCPSCGAHLKVSAHYRLRLLFDGGNYRELDRHLPQTDPLQFPGYADKLEALRESTGLEDAAVSAVGTVDSVRTVAAVLDSRFLMGSMGTVVGERITRATEYATKNRLPLIIFSASGGARMQEGILSLMQMAKTSAALERHAQAGLLYISVLTHPTTGGVTASFATLGDINLAEPGALIGFAGPRVIEQTIGQKLPEGFQRAEFLQKHGFIVSIVDRRELRKTLAMLLRMHQKGGEA